MIRLLHVAAEKASGEIWIDRFCDRLREIGLLTIAEDCGQLGDDERAKLIRQCDVLITGWGAAPVPASLADDPGDLQYICHVTGALGDAIPLEIIDSKIPVTNWGDAPAGRLAEGAMALLLACLKDLPGRTKIIRDGSWQPGDDFRSGVLDGLNVGIFGLGAIGRKFVEMLRPFGAVMRVFDPYVSELPEGCVAVDSLEELFDGAEAIVLHASLSDETRGAITAELLAKLPDNAMVINTARGAIIDQAALFAELETGRLRAGLDVLDPDKLPADHPARNWDNVILTAHDIGKNRSLKGFPPKKLEAMHRICLDNIARHLAGEPLRFRMDRGRYLRST